MDYFEHHIRHWLETEELYRSLFLLIFGSLFTIVTTYLVSLSRGYSFLSRGLYGGGIAARLKALPMLYTALKANRFFPGILQSARLLSEIQILNPAEPKPVIYDYDDEGAHKADVAKWTSYLADRSKTQKTQLQVLLEATRGLTAGRGRRKRRQDKQVEPEIGIPVAQIDASRAAIRRYFQVATEMNVDHADSFLSTINITEGFIAPTFLIAGIMTRYKQDWQEIIANYRRQLDNVIPPYTRELVELRSFQFNCWLLWGPSIPLCHCSQWTHAADDEQQGKHMLRVQPHRSHIELSYQYGFGDESNSVDLVIPGGTDQEWRNNMRARLTPSEDENAGSGAKHVVSAPLRVSARLKWGPAIEEDRIGLAQKAILGGAQDRRSRHRGRVVLEYLGEREGDSISSRYYSAYIWVMFTVMDMRSGAPFSAAAKSGMAPWQDLFPLFEHGNIADATTYLTLKKALAAKVCAVLAQFLGVPENAHVSVAFACAFDESCCGATVLYPTPRGESIRELIEAEAESSPLLTGLKSRVCFQPELGDPSLASYSSCQLPRRIEEFYADLERPA